MYRVELKEGKDWVLGVYVVWFLMYRVELKAVRSPSPVLPYPPVPNVPCGVESPSGGLLFPLLQRQWFLMYRVELKDNLIYYFLWPERFKRVPNVPCGVERRLG